MNDSVTLKGNTLTVTHVLQRRDRIVAIKRVIELSTGMMQVGSAPAAQASPAYVAWAREHYLPIADIV